MTRRFLVPAIVFVSLAVTVLVTSGAVAEAPTEPGLIAFHNGSEVFTIKPDGSALHQVSSEIPGTADPMWFGGGSRLGFTTDSAIVATDPDGANRERLMQADGFFPMHAAISSAGDRIAYLHAPTGDLVVANADGSNPRTISLTPSSAFLPAWSPDGLTIAYTHRNGSGSTAKYSIWLVDADGANHRQIIPESFDATGSAFSSDGSHIAFTSANAETGNKRVAIARADGSQLRIISPLGVRDSQPTFSPDGSRIAFVRTIEGSSSIWVMNVDGTGAHRIFDGTGVSPAWQPVPGTVPATTTTTSTTVPPNRVPTAEITFTWSADPLTVAVAGNSSTDPDGSIASYQWHWGDGSVPSSTKIAAHKYATAGSYRIRLTVTDDDGARGAAIFWVRVR